MRPAAPAATVPVDAPTLSVDAPPSDVHTPSPFRYVVLSAVPEGARVAKGPKPKFVLAPAALVAPVPPLVIATVPVTLFADVAVAALPVMFVPLSCATQAT